MRNETGADIDQLHNQGKKMKERINVKMRNKMTIARKLARVSTAVVLFCICGPAFNGQMNAAPAGQGSPHGAAGQMPAFYDGELFTVNMFEVPASDPLIEHNRSINTIYASNDLDEEQDFIPVIDAIQGEGFNPLWQQVLIVFNAGFTPHQFVSEEEIEAAAAAPNPEITLVVTDEVYRCSVVGRK